MLATIVIAHMALVTRRAAVGLGCVALGGGVLPVPACHAAVTQETAGAREALLLAISSGGDVASCIERLVRVNSGAAVAAATSPALDGRWELLWSEKAEAFSPLLGLPSPLRPSSFQLVGSAAAPVVGVGRIAQVLEWRRSPLSLILSSGAVAADDDPSVLEIFPPFRFETQIGQSRLTIVEAGSDAEFRATNLRSAEAQAAGRNLYKQLYLDTTGAAGDLRISTVVAGDPVIVGSVFIHQRT
jgi:hypothetical protein